MENIIRRNAGEKISMRINIVYEVNHREYNNCLLLQRELKRRGYDARIYNKTEDIVLFGNSKSITVIPNSYNTEDINHYRYTFNTKNELMIVYPCEQVTNHIMPDTFDYTENNLAKKYPHLCWSEDYYEFLNTLGYDMKFSSVVGAIQLDYCRPEFKDFYLSREEIARKFELDENKKWILFISDFVLDNELKYQSMLKSKVISKNVLDERRNHERASAKMILEWFDTFLSTHKEYILIYRKHPVEALSETIVKFQKNKPNQVYLISEYSIKDWIMNVDRITTWNSTSSVECYGAKKKIHLLRPIPFDENKGIKEYPFFRSFYHIDCYETFEKNLDTDNMSYSSEAIKEINKLYSIEEIPSFIRVADKIEEIGRTWKCGNVEKNYYFNKWKYIIKKQRIPRIIIKKILETLYYYFGMKIGKQNDARLAVNEWMATADNKKHRRKREKQLDSIIHKYHEKGEETTWKN